MIAEKAAKDQFSAIFGNRRGSSRDDDAAEARRGQFDVFLPSGEAGFGQSQKPPVSALQRADELLVSLEERTDAISVSHIIDGWFIQARRVGVSFGPEGRREAWEEYYEVFDEYEADGLSCVFGNPTDGAFATATPQDWPEG